MSQMIKAFLGVFLILFLTASAMGILKAYLQVLGAQDMQARMVDEIENSDFAAGVVRQCFADAGARGYDLAVTYYYSSGGSARFTRAAQVPSNAGGVSMARVELTFLLEMKLFHFYEPHTFTGYAR